ncbi:GNAT family N-acetyltransferase [Tateyamaria sp. SN3-11]|uniref:GNAT family N-acetyltransferase n=1 Tax=Tateyamaria sp. SN3-11 TaxID=3092147 RepID=UPI0039E83031
MAQDTCALRRAGPDDAARMEAFLAQHPATSMFLRSNLAAHGTDDTEGAHGTIFFIPDTGGPVTAVFAITNHGFLMAQAPDATPAQWAAFAAGIAGRRVKGMTGVPEQVQQCLRATGLAEGPWNLLADEPLYHLTIADMAPMTGAVRQATTDDLPILAAWFAAYESDTGQAPPSDPPSERAMARAQAAIGTRDVVLLEEDGAPVAMAGVNARLPDIVQIGGVFTPDGLRGKGYARRALAGLLRQCEAEGVTQSVLFANNAAAAHAYEALGYTLIGQYRIALLKDPIDIGVTG